MKLDTQIVEAALTFIDRPLSQPLRLSSGTISEASKAMIGRHA